MRRLIGVRRSNSAFSRGSLRFVRPSNRTVLAYVRQHDDHIIVCVANLSRSAQAAEIDLSPWKGRVPTEMLGRTAFPRIGELPYLVTLPPYGFFWFLLGEPSEPEAETRTLPREIITLVWAGDGNSLVAIRERQAFERDVLPHFLMERRWFADKARGLPAPKLGTVFRLEPDSAGATTLAFVSVPGERQQTSRYQLPLMVKWTRFDRSAPAPAHAIAAVRRGSREGTLIDAGGPAHASGQDRRPG
jgi:maltose alpha-D-glucosyltransferase/alpha-amylase